MAGVNTVTVVGDSERKHGGFRMEPFQGATMREGVDGEDNSFTISNSVFTEFCEHRAPIILNT